VNVHVDACAVQEIISMQEAQESGWRVPGMLSETEKPASGGSGRGISRPIRRIF